MRLSARQLVELQTLLILEIFCLVILFRIVQYLDDWI